MTTYRQTDIVQFIETAPLKKILIKKFWPLHRVIFSFAIVFPMVLILNGNSEMGAHVVSNLRYLIWLKHLIRSRVATNRILFLRKGLFIIYACVRFFLKGRIWVKSTRIHLDYNLDCRFRSGSDQIQIDPDLYYLTNSTFLTIFIDHSYSTNSSIILTLITKFLNKK